MKRSLVKYYLLFSLLIPELKVLAQLEHNYRSGTESLKQSELFPNKFIFSKHKYVYNKKRLRQKEVCLILKEKNDKAIDLLLQDAKRFRRTSKISSLIGTTTAVVGMGLMISGFVYAVDHDHYNVFTGSGTPISEEDKAFSRKLENTGFGITLFSITTFAVETTYNIKTRKVINRAVRIYNQKY